jgi:OOP family OmpA-OmpF porin
MRCCLQIVYGVPLALMLLVNPARADTVRGIMTDLNEMNPSGTSFTQELAKRYKAFSASEGYAMYDWIDAVYFAEKAMMANAGQTVAPDRPDSRELLPAFRPELQAAYGELNQALDQGAGSRFPDKAATAQVQYDCWLEQQEESHQPDDIAKCKAGFATAMAELRDAMRPPAPQASAATPKAEPKMVLGEEVAREVVYFEWDRAEIDAAAQVKLDAFVERMRPMKDIVLLVIGHADRSGTDEYNDKLSARRAENVRSELLRQGMTVANVDEVTIEAKGEREPAVATADGVREAANRRVEVTAHGMVNKMAQAAPQSTK